MMPWYILRIQSRLEQRAEDALKESGYDVYCPKVKVMDIGSARRKKVHLRNNKREAPKVRIEPLYKGYAFVREDRSLGVIGMLQDNHGVKLRGVLGVVKFGDRLAMISEDTVDNIRERVKAGELDAYEGVTNRPQYKIGQKVKWKSGALAGNEGVVKGVDRPNEIEVLTTLLGGTRPVVVTKLEELEALN